MQPFSSSKSNTGSEAKHALQNVTVERVSSPVFQIAQRVRDIIFDGDLTPGTRLPSTRELSDQLSVDVSSVHRALTLLVKEGLLLRTPYVGTFVAEPPKKKLDSLAFYFTNSTMGELGTFGRALLEEITHLGHTRGFSVEVFSDTRKEDQITEAPPSDLLRLARTRHIQGVVTRSISPKRIPWLEGLPVPFATISTPRHKHAYNWDREEMAAKAVRCLAKRGCKRIGMITTLFANENADADSYQMGLYNGFVKAAKEEGLEIHPGRMVGQAYDHEFTETEVPDVGYCAINKMWRELPQDQRPDGLFIYPDTMATGILLALAIHQVKVPDELHLVLHTNAEIPVFCPHLVDRVTVKVSDAAEALVRHVRYQLINRPTGSNLLPCHTQFHD